jgi:hypothetical protein
MSVTIEGIDYVSIAAVAKELATTEMKILMLLKRQALAGEQIEGDWYITAASLAAYDANAPVAETELSCRSTCTSATCGCH